MHKFKELEIWKKSRLYCSKIYSETAIFPLEEKFGLTNQLRRASVSTSYAEPIAISKNLEKSLFELLEDPSAIFDAIETDARLN
jgi:hypothetical protein